MRPDDLACANCSGPVSEGRCAVCRAARDRYGRGGGGYSTQLWVAVAIFVALICALVMEAHFA